MEKHKRHDFRKKILNIKYVFRISLQFCLKNPILIRTERGEIKNVHIQHVQYSLFLSDFNKTWIFWTDFRKILKCQVSWKSDHWEPSCSMRTDGQIIVAFRNFAKAPKNSNIFQCLLTISFHTKLHRNWCCDWEVKKEHTHWAFTRNTVTPLSLHKEEKQAENKLTPL